MGALFQVVTSEVFEISRLTDNEYVNLVGHFNRLVLKTDNSDDLAKRGYTREQIEEVYKARKNGKSPTPEVRSLNIHFKCPLTETQCPNFNYLYSMFDKYDKYGTLPYSGSHSEQPSKIIEVFDVLGAIKSEEQKRNE